MGYEKCRGCSAGFWHCFGDNKTNHKLDLKKFLSLYIFYSLYAFKTIIFIYTMLLFLFFFLRDFLRIHGVSFLFRFYRRLFVFYEFAALHVTPRRNKYDLIFRR